MRKGMTLIELLVIIAIFVVLLGLLVPAVLKAREAALYHESLNNLRQINLATANYAADHAERLPRISVRGRDPVFVALLPYLEQQQVFDYWVSNLEPPDGRVNLSLRVYLNPLDPSPFPMPVVFLNGISVTSYAYNAQAFDGRPSLASTFRDGTSNTILFSEHYGWRCAGVQFHYTMESAELRTDRTGSGAGRPSFADGGTVENGDNCGDYYPITSGIPPVSIAADNRTFQIRPRLQDCDPRLPNSSTSRGLQAGMADGSVRTLAPNIAPRVFWGAVTPAAGEVLDF
jgi:type II secretory pathway pseudopilin PulG